jgi:diacylglycerol O-acyltransferase / wax synthase
VPHGDRLTALDATFLHLEEGGAHMHVASILVFEGEAPPYDELVRAIEDRLHLVPRYRQRLAHVPLGQGRPVWVDDPYFNARYHLRHTALPAPGGDEQLAALAGRLFAQQLDRGKPLWEMYLVEGLHPAAGGDLRFALIAKTHHALVDGVSGVDITSVLFDAAPESAPAARPGRRWEPAPPPTAGQLLADALIERVTVPGEAARAVATGMRAPLRLAQRVAEPLTGLGAVARVGMTPAPASPFNVRIGPHRRYAWIDADLEQFKAIKNALGGTLNDVVLAAVALGLGRWMRRHHHRTEGVVLRALVPVSVRADAQRGALGNRVAAMYAPLPVGIRDAGTVFDVVHRAMELLKRSGQAVGAQAITQLADFAPPTILSQAARLQTRQRVFNLVVTNVPGPQVQLYALGRPLRAIHPVVPLARNTALGIAVMSYHGRLGFGLLGDYDAIADLDALRDDLAVAIGELVRSAGVAPSQTPGDAGESESRRPRSATGV